MALDLPQTVPVWRLSMQYNRNPARGGYLSELAYEPICLGAFRWTSPQLAIPTGTSRWAEPFHRAT